MGFYFSYFAVFSRFVLALIYFGYVGPHVLAASKLTYRTNTFIGASCMLVMLEAIWPSLKNLPNHLPASAGVASNKMIAYFVFWIRELHCTLSRLELMGISAVPPGHDPPS